MKLLTLIRHAKACPPTPDQPADLLRPLSDRGLRDAALIGQYLKSAFPVPPDTLLLSPSARTRRTASLIAQQAGLPDALLHEEPLLYEAPLSQLLAVLHALPSSVHHAACVGHNPGTQSLANWLCGRQAFPRFRTGAAAIFQLPVDSWDNVQSGDAVLLAQVHPSLIGGGRQAP